MSRELIEQSRTGRTPVELYEFIYGDNEGNSYTYTDAEQAYTFGSAEYMPITISRTKIASKGRSKNGEIKVTVPRSSEIAGLFRGVSPRRVVFLRIYSGYLGGRGVPSDWAQQSTVNLIWSGTVLESAPKTDRVELTCDTLGAGMKRPGLQRFYQRECPFVLYGPRCLADKSLATYPAQVESTGINSISLEAGDWNTLRDSQFYVGGILEWDGEYGTESRLILAVDGLSVRLDGPVDTLGSSDSVDMVLGCTRTLSYCGEVHGNVVRYGGTPYIPTTNPLNKNNHT